MLYSLGIIAPLAGCLGAEDDPESHVPDEWREERVKATGEPIQSKERLDGRANYDPEKEVVVINNNIERTPQQWLSSECPHSAADPVRESLGELKDSSNITVSVSSRDQIINVRRIIHLTRGGEVASSPEVRFDSLLNMLPQYVEMTVLIDGFEHTCQIEVFVSDGMSQPE